MLNVDERLLLHLLASEATEPTFDRFDVIESFLRSPDWEARAAALSLVAKLMAAPVGLVALAESLLNDENPLVRSEAVRVISRHSHKDRAIDLLQGHSEHHPVVRALIDSYVKRLSDPEGDES